MTRYRLPEQLGGAECVFSRTGFHPGWWVVELVDVAPGLVLEIEAAALVEVKPPLPEPPEGSVVLDANRKAWQRTGGHRGVWECCQDDGGADWEDLNGAPYAPLSLLVPAPEPVDLPWRSSRGPLADHDTTVVADLGEVADSIRADDRTVAVRLAPIEARRKARALWTAADAAEASP